MGKFLVLADKHAQLLVVDADIAFYHVLRCFTAYNVVFDEVEHHIGIVHCGFTVTILRKTVIVVPWFHHFYQFVNGMMERAGGRIISQHFAYFLFRETHHLIEIR